MLEFVVPDVIGAQSTVSNLVLPASRPSNLSIVDAIVDCCGLRSWIEVV